MTRDEEINQKARELALDWNVGSGNEFYYRLDKLVDIARWADRNQPNTWISVEERLPETGDDIIYLMNSGTPGRNQRYRKFDAEWFRMNVRHWQYANDPELKKGGEQ